MSTFVVAIEYAGTDVTAPQGGDRVPVLEHAYDLDTATLADHDEHPPRYAFPSPQRGWPSAPQFPRCAPCTEAVDSVVQAIVLGALSGLRLDLMPRRRNLH